MTAARIKELGDRIVELRARVRKSEAGMAAAAGLDLTQFQAHERAANEVWRQVHELEAKLANLTAGLPEDFGAPKVAQPQPVATPPKVKRAPAPDEPFPDIPPYPAGQSDEERSKKFSSSVDLIIDWIGKQLAAGQEIEALSIMVALEHVRGDWAAERIRALEQRCSDLEMALAKRSNSAGSKKLDALAARVAELEAGGIIYCGVWQRAAASYRKGALVTHAGSAWIALREAKSGEEPGKSDGAWQLAVKRGKDGKDTGP